MAFIIMAKVAWPTLFLPHISQRTITFTLDHGMIILLFKNLLAHQENCVFSHRSVIAVLCLPFSAIKCSKLYIFFLTKPEDFEFKWRYYFGSTKITKQFCRRGKFNRGSKFLSTYNSNIFGIFFLIKMQDGDCNVRNFRRFLFGMRHVVQAFKVSVFASDFKF